MLNSNVIGKICIHNYKIIKKFSFKSIFNYSRTYIIRYRALFVELMLLELRENIS